MIIAGGYRNNNKICKMTHYTEIKYLHIDYVMFPWMFAKNLRNSTIEAFFCFGHHTHKGRPQFTISKTKSC